MKLILLNAQRHNPQNLWCPTKKLENTTNSHVELMTNSHGLKKLCRPSSIQLTLFLQNCRVVNSNVPMTTHHDFHNITKKNVQSCKEKKNNRNTTGQNSMLSEKNPGHSTIVLARNSSLLQTSIWWCRSRGQVGPRWTLSSSQKYSWNFHNSVTTVRRVRSAAHGAS